MKPAHDKEWSCHLQGLRGLSALLPVADLLQRIQRSSVGARRMAGEHPSLGGHPALRILQLPARLLQAEPNNETPAASIHA